MVEIQVGRMKIPEGAAMISEGITGTCDFVVSKEDTAAAVGSGTLEVLATPRVAALMEMTAWKSIEKELEEGSTTVGVLLSLKHLAPTPVGGTVHFESFLEKVNARELTFRLTARDDAGMIAQAEHKRFVVDSVRFQKKAEGRLD